MSNEDNDVQSAQGEHAPRPPSIARPANTPRGFFALPPLLRRIFDQFPLVTYDANELPQRAPKNRTQHVLHIFTTHDDAIAGRPSFNPTCLKWQTCLKFAKSPFTTVASNNHASPTGTLPYLQPAGSSSDAASVVEPVPTNRLKRWLASQRSIQKIEETSDIRFAAYASLLDNVVRKAWLCQLYLSPDNTTLVEKLYTRPASSSPLVQMAITRQLASAARAELIKSTGTNVISAADLYRDAEDAIEAVSILLGHDDWCFGQAAPGLSDASIFAYTHLILEDTLPWKENPLAESLSRHRNLVQHRNRILQAYY